MRVRFLLWFLFVYMETSHSCKCQSTSKKLVPPVTSGLLAQESRRDREATDETTRSDQGGHHGVHPIPVIGDYEKACQVFIALSSLALLYSRSSPINLTQRVSLLTACSR